MKRFALFLCALLLPLSLLAAEAVKFTVSAFTFTLPEGWKQVEVKSPMRKAQLEVPGKEGGKPAEITFFHFGEGQGGDVQGNVQRWFAQFEGGKEAEKSETVEAGGVKITFVSTKGTMKASPMSGVNEAQPDFALRGAILDHAEGAVFIKLTGPSALVKDSEEKFLALVKGAAEKK